MAVVTSTQPGTFVNPGSYLDFIPAPPAPTSGPNTSLLAIVGTGQFGQPNTPTPASGPNGAAALVGPSTALNRGIMDAIRNGAYPQSQQYLLTRVTDGTDVAAVSSLLDATGFALLSLTGTGTVGASQTAAVSLVNGSTNVSIPAFALTVGQSASQALAAIAAAVNASLAVNGSGAFLGTAAVSGSAITFVAAAQGTAGNAITVQITIAGSGFSASSGVATALAGGATAGTQVIFTGTSTGSALNNSAQYPAGARFDYTSAAGSTSPTGNLTLFHGPLQQPTVFRNIACYASAGGGFNAAAFQANVIAAVNAGTASQAPDLIWTATAGASTATSVLAGILCPASGGTDGASGVTAQTTIGVDGSVGRTGVYALRRLIRGGTVIVAGLGNSSADAAWAQTLDAFCSSELCISGVTLGPAGTTPAAAGATKAANAVSTPNLLAMLGEPYYVDPSTGVSKLVNPAGAILGTVSGLNPWQGPLNQPSAGIVGVVGTEWTTTQIPDDTALQQANIAYIKRESGRFVVWNDRMSDGTPVADTRMRNYIGVSLETIGKKYVGQMQPAMTTNNPILADYLSDCNAFLTRLKQAGQITNGNTSGAPDTVTTIEQGFLIGQTAVQTLSGIRYVLNIAAIGGSVVVSPT